MTQEVIIYTFICDSCGTNCNEDTGYSGWDDIDFSWQNAEEDNWITEGDKHYCPQCYSYNDNDELELKPVNQLK